MPGCAVAKCKNTNRNTKGTGIKYFGFPKNKDLAEQWITACRREDKINLKYARICSIHFEEDSFEIPLKQKLLNYCPKNSRNLKGDAVPVLGLPGPLRKPKNAERTNRICKRRQRSTVVEILKDSSYSIEPEPSPSMPEHPFQMFNDEPMLVEVDESTIIGENTCEKKEHEINKLEEKIKMLEEQNKALLQSIEEEKDAFGTDLENQKTIINQISKFIISMRVGNHKEMIPFQKGILLSNRSLMEMCEYLFDKYKIDYILTSRLNQYILENFFAYIRGMGGANDHPSPMNFSYRLRWYILGKNSAAIFTENRNTMETEESCLLNVLDETSPSTSNLGTNEICLTQKMLSGLVREEQDEVLEKCQIEEDLSANDFVQPNYLEEEIIEDELLNIIQNFEAKEKISLECLKYIAGYVAYKFKNKYSLGIPTKKIETS